MEQYIFGARNGVHILNLEQTAEKLKEACEFVRDLVANGGVIVFVGTKNQATEIIKKYATEAESPYVIKRWLGGTLTNFSQIRSRVKHYLDLKKKQATGGLEKYTKKEQLEFSREIENLGEMYDGVVSLEKRPDALFIVDIQKEKTAVREAKQTGAKIIAICDTNINPDLVDRCIPGNDDAVKSIELFTRSIAEAVKEGRGIRAKNQKAAAEKVVKKMEEKKA